MNQQLSFDLDPIRAVTKRSPEIGSHDRSVAHQGVTVTYRLQRSRRRSIGLTVAEEGLRVSAPSWVGLRQIDQAVIEKFDWVQRKLQALQVRHNNLAAAASQWRSGGQLAYLGCRIILRCGMAPNQTTQNTQNTKNTQSAQSAQSALNTQNTTWFDGDPDQPTRDQALWLALPEDVDSARLRDLVQTWLQQRAKAWFGQRLAHFEAITGLAPSSWKLSSANTRWGVCNSDQRILLNWRLIHFQPKVIDYVIAHELAHLKEMNHSQAFWDNLKSIYPDYIEGHKALKGLSPGDTPTL